jgi:soluble P-type ATPase
MLKLQTTGLGDVIKKIKSMGHEVFIIGGDTLGCAIIPGFAKEFGIEKDHIYSGYFKDYEKENIQESFPNEWRYVNCANPDLPTPKSLNKSELIKGLKERGIINGHVVHIGDGENDLEVWQNDQADVFIGFGVNKYRKKVEDGSKIYVKNIDQFKKKIDELLYINKDLDGTRVKYI